MTWLTWPLSEMSHGFTSVVWGRQFVKAAPWMWQQPLPGAPPAPAPSTMPVAMQQDSTVITVTYQGKRHEVRFARDCDSASIKEVVSHTVGLDLGTLFVLKDSEERPTAISGGMPSDEYTLHPVAAGASGPR